MSFSPEFLDELRQRLPLSEVIGRKVRLVRKGREYGGLCPFHNEKTPSFTVNDDKGFYHCFGCQAHGDVISFVIETEGLTFPEAVERLAAEAGLQVPQSRPEDRQAAERKATLYDVLEMAAGWYESQLHAQSGQAAMEYLQGRGLDLATIRAFRLGLAPDMQTGLKDALAARKVSPNLMEEAGLLVTPDDGRPGYDRFRHRVIFPITDQRGRVVAFGGRALGDAKAKYLNSPETPLFHKGRLLYNLDHARKAAHDAGAVIVVEGYMDVIALAQAGFTHSVAPLGTALTEEQLTLLWRMAAEPSLCFDGDSAGLRAASRAAERALPMIKPGHSLKFVFLPEGEDPDSFIKSGGVDAMTTVLEKARPLADVLWDMLTSGARLDTPERRAGIETKINTMLSHVEDKRVQGYYRTEFRDRLNRLISAVRGIPMSTPARNAGSRSGGYARGRYGDMGRQARRPLRGGNSWPEHASGLARTEVGRASSSNSLMRERLMILIVINHPELLAHHVEEFSELELSNPDLDKLRCEIIRIAACESALDRNSLKSHLKEQDYKKALDSLTGNGVLANVWYAWPDAALEDAIRGWQHVVSFHRRVLSIKADLAAEVDELGKSWTEESYKRLCALKAQLEATEGQEASLEGFGLASGREVSA